MDFLMDKMNRSNAEGTGECPAAGRWASRRARGDQPRVIGSSPAQARGGGEIVNIRCTKRMLTTLSSGIWLNVPIVITLSVDPLLCVAVDSPVRTVRQCCIRWSG